MNLHPLHYSLRALLAAVFMTLAPSLLPAQEIPVGEPYGLTVNRLYSTRVGLAWADNASNETGFRLIRTNRQTGVVTTIPLPAGTTSYLDTGLTANTSYYFQIQVFNSTVDGPVSNRVGAITPIRDSAPSPPAYLAATDLGGTSAKITWRDESFSEDSFVVEYAVSPFTTYTVAGTVPYNTVSFNVAGLAPTTVYSFRVRAVNTIGERVSTPISISLRLGGEFRGHAREFGGIYYFAFSGPNRIERYDLAAREWLSPLPLQAAATALWADEAGIYAAEGTTLVRWSPDGTIRSLLTTVSVTISQIFTIGNILAIVKGTEFSTLDRNSGVFYTSFDVRHNCSGISVSPLEHRAYYRTSGTSSGRLFYVDLGADGRLITQGAINDSLEHADAKRTFVWPGGDRVADDSGAVYATAGLDYVHDLGGAFKDLSFRGEDVPIVLRGNKVYAYRNTQAEAGSFTLSSASGERIAVHGTDVVAFLADGASVHGMSIQVVPLASINAPEPNEPVDPSGLAYSVDDAYISPDGVAVIFDRAIKRVFRWSTAQRQYLPGSIPLSSFASSVTYSAEANTLYAAYPNRQVSKIPLNASMPEEAPLLTLSAPPGGLAAAGDFVFLAESSQSWYPHSIYTSAGTLIQKKTDTWTSHSRHYEWDAVRRRVYFFSDNSISGKVRYETIAGNGVFTEAGESPGSESFPTEGPIRVSPDGALLAFGGGVILRASDLAGVVSLRTSFADMVWCASGLAGLERLGTNQTRVQFWDSEWGRSHAGVVEGLPARILKMASGALLVITTNNRIPQFHILNQSGQQLYTSAPSTLAILQHPVSQRESFNSTARFEVTATGAPPLNFQWFIGAQEIPGATSSVLEVTNSGSMDAGVYRVRVSSGSASVTSNPATLRVGPVSAPLFEEGNLIVSYGSKLYEYRPSGVLVQTITAPPPPGVDAAFVRLNDSVVDSMGQLHVFSLGDELSIPPAFVSTYDPELRTWRHLPSTGPVPGFAPSAGRLSLLGDWLITGDGRLHLSTGMWRPHPQARGQSTQWTFNATAGLDGEVYVRFDHWDVRKLLSEENEWSSPIFGDFGNGGAIAVDAAGNLFLGREESGFPIAKYSPSGQLLAKANIGGNTSTTTDIALSPSGSLAASYPYQPFVTITNTSFASPARISIPQIEQSKYVNWAPALIQPSPAFAPSELPPAAKEGIPFSWIPQTSHPDPDAQLVFTAVQIPAWLSLTASGQLSGTPPRAQTGNHEVIIRVRDQNNRTVAKSFTINVAEANNRPVAVNRSLDRSEDAVVEDFPLSEFITDEETAVLSYSVESNSGGGVSAEVTGGKLRITYLPNAHGPAVLIVRGTDEGGLSAESVISMSVLPVNDLPEGSLTPLVMDEDAPVTVINLDTFFSDVESPDTALSYSIVRNAGGIVTSWISGHQLRVTPLLNAFGDDSLTVRCEDPDGGAIELPLLVSIRSVNDLPAGEILALSADEDSAPFRVDLTAAFADVETADAGLRFTAFTSAPEIVRASVTDGVLTFTPQLNASGALTYTVQCEDADGGTVTLTTPLTIVPVNDPPVIPAAIPNVDAGGAAQDSTIDLSLLATDPDPGDTMAWRIVRNTNPSIFRHLAFDAAGQLSISYAPWVSGDSDITVEVRDAAGTVAESTFRVLLPVLPPPVFVQQSALTLNLQTGLWEQHVTVRNEALRAIGGFEIRVEGLPSGVCLYNASECRADIPFAGYYQPVEPGAGVSMVLEYYSPNRHRITLPLLNTAPALPRNMASSSSGDFTINRAEMLATGAFLLEFPSEPGSLYQVQYSQNNLSWIDSLVRIRAAGTRVQWIDQGAPRTISPPGAGQPRFYRIKKLP